MPGKRSRRDKKGPPEIPVSSFSDIAFLLIIFFILVTTLDKITGFVGELPAGERSEAQTDKAPTVQLHHERLRFNDRDTDMDGLRESLEKLNLHNKQQEQKVVLLEATGAVKYQLYYEVMSAIDKAGGVVAMVKEEEKKK